MIRETTSFHRQFPIQLRLKEGVAFFYFSAGFTGKMNQDTGMIVSLPDVDQAMKQLIVDAQKMQFSEEFHFLKHAVSFLGKDLNIFEVALRSETQIFFNRMGILQSWKRENLQVKFQNEEKLFWIFSENPRKKKMDAANLNELLQKLSKQKENLYLVDPLTETKYFL